MFHLYVETFQQQLHIEYISLIWTIFLIWCFLSHFLWSRMMLLQNHFFLVTKLHSSCRKF